MIIDNKLKKKVFALTCTFFFSFSFFPSSLPAQGVKGINQDPDPQGPGRRPYEMAGRQEQRPPALTFEDCSRWTVESKGAEAALYRSNDQLLYRDYVGKLTYRATDKSSEIVVRPLTPVPLPDSADCIDFWNYGAHWLWGKPHYRRALRHYALLRDGEGEIHTVSFVQSGYNGMVYKYWFLNHIKLPEDMKRPLTFEGILFRGSNITGDQPLSIYLGPLYFYKEELQPLRFAEYPDTLPFPLRPETILPLNKTKDFSNRVEQGKGYTDFVYKGKDAVLRYRVHTGNGLPLDISLVQGRKSITLCREGGIRFAGDKEAVWQADRTILRHDTLWVEATATVGSEKIPFRFFYTLRQKSLIAGMEELSRQGHVAEVRLGTTGPLREAQLFSVPFLNFDYAIAPRILYGDGLFFFMQFDWYYTDASLFFMEMPEVSGGYAIHNGGARYIPMTNGVRNPLHEKLFITVSSDVQEVFPTVDNPPSPMRALQAGRLWRINGSADYAALKVEADTLRSLGIAQLTIRYHEGFWRDDGESYTFRLEAAPGRGGNSAVKELVQYIESKGWRVGLYSNYTDLAPVNRNWDPDMMMQGPHGGWTVSWSRCYAPKPMRALEYERTYAPLIHQMFGSNHSYCDVHTAVSPMSRVDYDYRVPGAATFRRTFECFGQILYNEKQAYAGPVYSEGANHWWYAGLVDGNYANARPALDKRPVFPDFQLLKLHPLEMDAGNTQATGRKYVAYTLAYGNIGICDGTGEEMMHRYYMLQPLQEHYVMVPVREIGYEKDGKFFDASSALVKGLTEAPHLHIIYRSGFEVYINFGETPWHFRAGKYDLTLPQYGFFARSGDGRTLALAGREPSLTGGADADILISPEVVYLDSRGAEVNSSLLAGKGKIAMKKEPFGWEIIPARSFVSFAFDPSLTGLQEQSLRVDALDSKEMPLPGEELHHKQGVRCSVLPRRGAWKYRLVPLPRR